MPPPTKGQVKQQQQHTQHGSHNHSHGPWHSYEQSDDSRPAVPTINKERIVATVIICGFVLSLLTSPYYSLSTAHVSLLISVCSCLLLLLVSVLLYRSFTFPNYQLSAHSVAAPHDYQQTWERLSKRKDELCRRLSKALQIMTVSYDDRRQIDHTTFIDLHNHLVDCFPNIHKQCKKTIINKYSLVFKYTGTEEAEKGEAARKPLLLLAHQDVVPVTDADEWKHPPFSGLFSDGYVHGRGAIDCKNNLMAVCEAMEDLLSQGIRLRRSFYLCFGHDEEIQGMEGAKIIAEHLEKQNIRFDFCLDEGLFIIRGAIPLYPKPVAMVCTAEKGFVTAELQVNVGGGSHSAAPEKEGAISIISRALTRINDSPAPAYYGVKEREMMEWLCHGFSFPMRMIVSNLWLFSPLLKFLMTRKSSSAAVLRSTTALTVVQSGSKVNVLPPSAHALVNHRLHPYDSVNGMLNYDRAVINDARVHVSKREPVHHPSGLSSPHSSSFHLIHRAILTVFPDVSVSPALCVGATDSRHYEHLCDNVYRFTPVYMNSLVETKMFHGRNEKIGMENYLQTVAFFSTLLKLCDEGG